MTEALGFAAEEGESSVMEEKDKSFYYCTNCEQEIATLATGVCPLCNSQAVIPVGWDHVSTQERTDWFKRIHGGRRNITARTRLSPKQQLLQQKKKPGV